MKIGYFTERPYQDPRIMGVTLTDLDLSNDIYDADLSADLFDRYIDEKIYAEEMGFDMLMLNEHHSTPFQLGGVLNVEACILAARHQQGQDRLDGQRVADMGRPAVAGRDARDRRRDLTWSVGVRVGAGHRPRERRPQRAGPLQLGALPRSPRLHHEDVELLRDRFGGRATTITTAT